MAWALQARLRRTRPTPRRMREQAQGPSDWLCVAADSFGEVWRAGVGADAVWAPLGKYLGGDVESLDSL